MNGSSRSLIRAIRGPVTLITIGVLFALNNFTPYGFDKTWPVLLIVFGLLSLLRRGMEPVPPEPTAQPFSYPPPPPGGYSAGSPGSYAGSSYTAPPQQPFGPATGGPAKGGFGTSAPARPGDAGSTGSAGTGSAGTGSAGTPGESL
jgi:hypothetical protein